MYRNFCFTLNNYTEEEYDAIIGRNEFSYVVIGREVGANGTAHLQGYAELKQRTRYNTVHNYFGGRAHCEERKGTQEQAIAYCCKDGDFEERGGRRNQGDRRDLDKVRRAVLDGGIRAVSRTYNLQGIRVAEKFLTYNEPCRDWKPDVWWIWGKTGVGKSKLARELLGEDVYVKNDRSKWWDGYDAHEDIILDDYRKDWDGGFTALLGLLDRYEYKLECKGGWRQCLAKRIVITCPNDPVREFGDGNERIDQLLRRIDYIILVDPDVPEVGGVILDPPPLDI